MTDQNWVNCTFAEAVTAGIEKCQYFASDGRWNNFGHQLIVNVAVTRQWRRPAAETDKREIPRLQPRTIPDDPDDDCEYFEVPAAKPRTTEDWHKLNGLWIDDAGTIRGTASVDIVAIQDGVGGISLHETIPTESVRRTCRELQDRWQRRQKPKLPTIKAPEGCSWEYHAELGESILRLPNDSVLPLSRVEWYRALVAAFDELYGIETVEFDANVERGSGEYPVLHHNMPLNTNPGGYTITMRRKGEKC